jgi:small subunit ribosomal protein S4e
MKNGDIQLNLHDGKNIKIKVADPTKQSEDVYKTLDVLKINLADNQILEHLKFEEGSYAIIFGGKNIGKYGKIVAIEKASKASKPIVTIECSDGNRYNSVADYVFIIGKDKPLISLPEAK